jgi:glucose-1-phosphate cytidylyltransferase
MKVVLFCGGLGMRLREHAENIPKPLVHVGLRPILWHVMKYYAHFGHTDFIICLGWKGDQIKQYFKKHAAVSSGSANGHSDGTLHRDLANWNIQFVDTGLNANVGQRLHAGKPYLAGEEVFLANYADGLSDLPLPQFIEQFHRRQATAAFIAVRPHQSWHSVDIADDGAVEDVQPINNGSVWMNGGFFVLSHRIFDVLHEGEELVEQPFRRLIDVRKLLAYKYDGFWSCMDTYKDKQCLEDLVAAGNTPWEVWNEPATRASVEVHEPTEPVITSPLLRSRSK